MLCKICLHLTHLIGKAQVLGKYEVQYFQCGNCGFIQTEYPYWLDEAYSNAISQSDLGLVGRNIALAQTTSALITAFFDSKAEFLDYAGGYGMFVRLMRDSGFDFYWYDRFCTNLFATGFEADAEDESQYELLTAFEVLEHLVNPLDEIEQMLRLSKSIFFTTLLIPAYNPKPGEWWYYALDSGQHVVLYSHKTLSVIAEEFHLNLYSNGRSLHLLTYKRIVPPLFNLVLRSKFARLLNLASKRRRKSLRADDYYLVTGTVK